MAPNLVILLVLAVAPCSDELPASGAFAKSSPTSAVRCEPRQSSSWEESDHVGGPSKGVSSRRTFRSPSASGLRLASANAAETLTTSGETGYDDGSAMQDLVASADCCECQACVAPQGQHHLCCPWGIVGLPSPHRAPGDMTQHIPYTARPQSYYYLRPYNYFHIEEHQREVAYYDGDPKEPYANRFFERVYDRTVAPYEHRNEAEPIIPMEPLRRR